MRRPRSLDQQMTHSRPLILRDKKEISIEDGSVYVRLKCQLLLHKLCAELSPKIKHPFHPTYPLVLRNINMECFVLGFNYWCAKCDTLLSNLNFTSSLLLYSTRTSVTRLAELSAFVHGYIPLIPLCAMRFHSNVVIPHYHIHLNIVAMTNIHSPSLALPSKTIQTTMIAGNITVTFARKEDTCKIQFIIVRNATMLLILVACLMRGNGSGD
ncbi:uncharacterized protein LOC132273763 isoform X1 [Cornus florida]|uniref:uncharacterized protein LOC132273763 isoform X1 n=1 Tax=Cornus florida TaxID=4283 RepID=UPI0028A0586B|nr:uncharacterized protein LOC132273763 isoform X1 [Cornus florida]